MSQRYWSKWGDPAAGGQTVGFDGFRYYVKSETGQIITVFQGELDDLVYKLLKAKRKVEGE
jgi:hypothetical protein